MNTFEEYLKQIGLGKLISHAGEFELNTIVEDVFAAKFPELSEEEVKQLYIYNVPKMSADGSCSIIEEKAEKPYNLAETFGILKQVQDDNIDWAKLKNHPQTIRLWRLKQIVSKIYEQSEVEWFGIYRKVTERQNVIPAKAGIQKIDSRFHGNDNDGNSVLVKEAYAGLFSRAEFPLTREFAKKSNNSTVGLSGKAIVIQDVSAHTGAYYKCDGKVNSEFCAPIISFDGRDSSTSSRNDILGIIDAEAFATNHYSSERLLQIAKVAYDLGQKGLGI